LKLIDEFKMIDIKEYNFPDEELIRSENPADHCVIWQPESISLILGQSNKGPESVHAQKAMADNIPVYKRPSGGQAVLISPNTIIISVIRKREKFQSIKPYFEQYNNKIIEALESFGISNLRQNGISDISIGDKKILGSAIYQNKDRIFYHAVLNVKEDAELIGEYLKHPPQEPDYREGRSHTEFVTSLAEQGYELEIQDIVKTLQQKFTLN